MRHSTKMELWGFIISIISVISWSFIIYLSVEGFISVYVYLHIAVLFVAAIFGPYFYRHATRHLIKKARRLQTRIKFCFFCGASLQQDPASDICPACNSSLNLVEIIDE